MKKKLSVCAILCITWMMCMSFTGCQRIDEMRKRQAFITDDGNIMLDDVAYIRLPECDYLNPELVGYEDYEARSIYVTEEDVPVLLSEMQGCYSVISKDKVFIQKSGEYDYYYCREDMYDTVLASIEKGYEPDGYKCWYYDYEADESKCYLFSEAEIEAIEKTLATSSIEGVTSDYYQIVGVESYMEETYFSRYEFDLMMKVTESGNVYYLVRYDDQLGVEQYYRIPEEYTADFEVIMEKCFLENEVAYID